MDRGAMKSIRESPAEDRKRLCWKRRAAEVTKVRERPLSAPLRTYTPTMQSLHMASQHRVGCVKRRPPQKGPSIGRSRSRAKSASTMRSLSTTSHYDDNASVTSECDVSLTAAELDKFYLEDDEDEYPPQRSPYDTCQQLYLTACRFLGVVPATTCFKGLVSRDLMLASHGLAPTGAKACAIALTSNGCVESLDLQGNALGAEGSRYISQMLETNDFISHVSLADNNLGSEGLQCVCSMLANNHNIRRIDLSGNQLGERDGPHLAEMLMNNFTLKELVLHHNNFSIAGAEAIANGLENNDSLELLDLSWNHIRLGGARAIANSLQGNIGLKKLFLAFNGFGLDGCKAMSNALKKNVTLYTLDLSNNRVDQTCLEHLLKGLQINTALTSLLLSDNHFFIDGCKAILDMVTKSPSCALSEVDISNQSVDVEFTRQLEQVKSSRVFSLRHGVVVRPDQAVDNEEGQDILLNEDPMMVLMEFMRLNNYRLVDLFTSLDQDNNWSLSREEFRVGLEQANVPLGSEALDKLISSLDKNGDSEVDFQELIAGQREHRRKVSKMKLFRRNSDDYLNSELGRVSEKLRLLMSIKFFKKRRESYKSSKKLEILPESSEPVAQDKMATVATDVLAIVNNRKRRPGLPAHALVNPVFTQTAVLNR